MRLARLHIAACLAPAVVSAHFCVVLRPRIESVGAWCAIRVYRSPGRAISHAHTLRKHMRAKTDRKAYIVLNEHLCCVDTESATF